MPIDIKDKSGKKVYGVAMVANTTRCGHCDSPVLDGQPFWVLDEPYGCLVHDLCFGHFNWNGLARTKMGEGRVTIKEELSVDEEVVSQYMQKAHFKTKVPTLVREAWRKVFHRALLLRRHYSKDALKKWSTIEADTEIVNFDTKGTHYVREIKDEAEAGEDVDEDVDEDAGDEAAAPKASEGEESTTGEGV
jgi:hypothetical protein